jgi:hypothetical protein
MPNKTVKKFPQLQPGREITEDDMDLGLNLFKDFGDCIEKRNADFKAIFVALSAIVEALTRGGNPSIDQLTSSIGHHAAQLQDAVNPNPKNH